MKQQKQLEIEKKWQEYLPLKYVTKFPIQPKPLISKTTTSIRHQTEHYHVEQFYKVISKIY